jgi:hypothetical protein
MDASPSGILLPKATTSIPFLGFSTEPTGNAQAALAVRTAAAKITNAQVTYFIT